MSRGQWRGMGERHAAADKQLPAWLLEKWQWRLKARTVLTGTSAYWLQVCCKPIGEILLLPNLVAGALTRAALVKQVHSIDCRCPARCWLG